MLDELFLVYAKSLCSFLYCQGTGIIQELCICASVYLMAPGLKGRMKQKASELSKIHLKVSSNAESQWDFKQYAMWKVTGKNVIINLSVPKKSPA